MTQQLEKDCHPCPIPYSVIRLYCFASVSSACVLLVNAVPVQLPLFFITLFALILASVCEKTILSGSVD